MLPRALGIGVIAVLAATAMPRPVDAVGVIASFTPTSSGSITYTVSDVHSPALPGSQTYGFTVTLQTGVAAGSIALTAPAITGTAGNSIRSGAFSASCNATSDAGAIFTSLGIVRLASTPVDCGTIAPLSVNTLKFNVTLYLDKMANASAAFSADVYASGMLAVTVNAP